MLGNTNSLINTLTMDKTRKYNDLTDEEKRVILHKSTEMPGSSEYNQHTDKGVYVCKQCEAPLYESNSKFDGHCGWPAFDDEIKGAVHRIREGRRQRADRHAALRSAFLEGAELDAADEKLLRYNR